MTLYALVPVRVKIKTNSAVEINRAQKLVAHMIDEYQAIVEEWFKNGNNLDDSECADPIEAMTNRIATKPEETTFWVEKRDPLDAIEVTEES